MTTLLVFAVLLLVAVLFSELARRSVLSSAVLFLFAGFIAGPHVLGWVAFRDDRQVVFRFAEVAMFAILYTDGMRVKLRAVPYYELPARALGIGLPLTIVFNAVLARWIIGLPWAESFLLGTILGPTDPVLASALIGHEHVPVRLRRLLNIESGLNDGLTLPVVVILLSVAARAESHWAKAIGEVGIGVALGFVVPWLAIKLERHRFFSTSKEYEALHGLAIALLIFALSPMVHANEFLAAFTAGVTSANLDPEFRRKFQPIGEAIGELLKLATLLVFGALISPTFLTEIGLSTVAFVLLVLLVVRPVALGISLLGTGLEWREWVAAVWFGPKGFSSVYYALLVLASGITYATDILHLSALVIAASVIAHSSTDVVVAQWFERSKEDSPAEPQAKDAQRGAA